MVSSINRNWVGGLSSGIDTQGLIEKMMNIERLPVKRLEQRRNTLDLQKSMLQGINLKLFDLQSRAIDLTFSRTFNSKKVTSSDDRAVNAMATTAAKVGTHIVRVRQLATTTTVGSDSRLAASLERGPFLESTRHIGGRNLTLSALGITPGDLRVDLPSGGGTKTLALGLTGGTTLGEAIDRVNQSIQSDADLRGTLRASFDERTNQMRFDLLDSSRIAHISDASGGSIISQLFVAGPLGFRLDRDTPTRTSDPGLTPIRSGTATTVTDLGLTLGTVMLRRQNAPSEPVNPEVALNLATLTGASTVSDLVRELNRQIDGHGSLVRGGAPTGNPADRLVEFRYDEASRRLQLINRNSADVNGFVLTDGTGNLGAAVFGGAGPQDSTSDAGVILGQETLARGLISGTFTIDGVRISVDSAVDTLQNVLSRITSSTSLNATYDSRADVLRLTRKDGSNTPVGMGGPTDTSNFLSVMGLISGSQASEARKSSASPLGISFDAARGAGGQTLQSLGLVAGAGTMRVTVDGAAHDLAYSGTETLRSFLERVNDLAGVGGAFYNASTGRVEIHTSRTGSSARLRVEDLGGGSLAANLRIAGAEVVGSDLGSSVVSSRPISGINRSATLDTAGFAQSVTAGNFTINGVSFLIGNPASMTIDSLISTINSNARVGVRAEFDETTGGLMLTSNQTGNTTISLGAAGDTSNFLVASGMLRASPRIGQNAIFSVGGVSGGADLVRQSNDINDVIDGVTFQLRNLTGPSGETITVSADTELARKAIDDFITAYNAVTQTVFDRLSEKRDWSIEALTDEQKRALDKTEREQYEGLFKQGLLAGDSTLTTIRSRMRIIMSSAVPGIDNLFNSLSELGISTGKVGSDYKDTQVGTLKITNEEKLTEALRDNSDKVFALFANDSASEANMGVARRLRTVLNEFTKSDGLLTKRVGRSGVAAANSEMDKQIRLINDQISRQQTRLQAKEEALIRKFSNLESALSRYQSQSQAFSQQLAQLTGGK